MSSHGGRREGAGRKPGVPNKVGGEIREIAREFGPGAIQRLALMAGLLPGEPGADSHAVQVSALKELLDRGYGRATTVLAGDDAAGPMQIEFRWRGEGEEPKPEFPLTIDSNSVSECAEEAARVDSAPRVSRYVS